MGSLNLKFRKSTNALILLLISLLGFTTACSDDQGEEYGTPTAHYIVIGNVSSVTDNKLIPDIIIEMRDVTDRGTVPIPAFLVDTGYSNSGGEYDLSNSRNPSDKASFQIKFTDTDGPANGEYQSLDTTVVFQDPVFSGGNGSWYEGYVKKVLDVKLKPKE